MRSDISKLLFFPFVLLFVLSCSKENFLRLSSSDNIRQYIPDYSSPKRFASTTDTIVLSLQESSHYFVDGEFSLSTGGTLPDFDKVELERTTLTIGCDTPYLRFHFQLRTEYNNQLPTRSEDQLFITFEDSSGTADAGIQLNFTDSLRCVSGRCAFQDTLNILSGSFRNVYFTQRDNISRNFLYVNSSGLIGFRTSDQKTYELIP